MELVKCSVNVHRMTDWCITDEYDYKSALPKRRCVYGKKDGDNYRTLTSPIVEFRGRVVVTQSGTIYILGSIDSSFIKHIQDNNIPYDYQNPISDSFLEDTRSYKTFTSYGPDSSRNYSNYSSSNVNNSNTNYGYGSTGYGGYNSWSGSSCPVKAIKPKEKEVQEVEIEIEDVEERY